MNYDYLKVAILIFNCSSVFILPSCISDTDIYTGKYALKRSNGRECEVELLENGKCIVECDGQLLFDWSILRDKRLHLTSGNNRSILLTPIEFESKLFRSWPKAWILEHENSVDTLVRRRE